MYIWLKNHYCTLTVGFKSQFKATGLITCIRYKVNKNMAVRGLEEGRGAGTTDTFSK